MLENLEHDLKKVFLAGVGALAVTAEKSKTMIDTLVQKGALTVEQGKSLNEELKHHAQEKQSAVCAEALSRDLEHLTPEDLAKVKTKLAELENQNTGQ